MKHSVLRAGARWFVRGLVCLCVLFCVVITCLTLWLAWGPLEWGPLGWPGSVKVIVPAASAIVLCSVLRRGPVLQLTAIGLSIGLFFVGSLLRPQHTGGEGRSYVAREFLQHVSNGNIDAAYALCGDSFTQQELAALAKGEIPVELHEYNEVIAVGDVNRHVDMVLFGRAGGALGTREACKEGAVAVFLRIEFWKTPVVQGIAINRELQDEIRLGACP